MYACTTGDPRIADVLLREIRPGDLVRVTGTITQPDDSTAPARLVVDALEVLVAAPIPVLHEMVMDRWGMYCAVFDADRDKVAVFTTSGRWVGEATSPEAIGDMIDAWENGGDD